MTKIENDYMHPEYLIETAWLEEHLDVANLRVFDCTVNVSPNPDLVQRKQNPFIYQSGRKNYDKITTRSISLALDLLISRMSYQTRHQTCH